GLIILSILGFTQPALSNEKNDNPVELKFLGRQNHGPVFQLNLNNTMEGKFLIRVRDAGGNLLYSEKLKGKNVTRRYQVAIDPELYEEFNVRFEITSVTTRETLIYDVANNRRAVDNVVVAKL
ncbi:MAG TPA: hypothetical protein VNA26_04750, partial [Chitinophagaceae bacterium]|nr:hypothetical protein [Chitinophagaceae bacterium]